MCGVQCALGCVCDRLARVVGRARRCCFQSTQRRCVFVAAWPCPADPTPRTCIACGAYVVLLFSSDARSCAMHLLHVRVPAPSPRRPARGDASPATPHAPRVVTHVAHAWRMRTCRFFLSASPTSRIHAHAHAWGGPLVSPANLTFRVWWPTSRMHGACAHWHRRTCSFGQGGASRLGTLRPRPPQLTYTAARAHNTRMPHSLVRPPGGHHMGSQQAGCDRQQIGPGPDQGSTCIRLTEPASRPRRLWHRVRSMGPRSEVGGV